MTKAILRSFGELVDFQPSGPIAPASRAAAPPPVFARPPAAAPRAASAAPAFVSRAVIGPELGQIGSVASAVEKLSALADLAYSARGMPHMMALARTVVEAVGRAERRENPDSRRQHAPAAIRGLERLLRNSVGHGAGAHFTATRCMKVLRILDDVPAVSESGYARLSNKTEGGVVFVEDPREASTALGVFLEFHQSLNVGLMTELEKAKIIPPQSLRDPRLVGMRRVLPDFGGPLVLAAMASLGFSEGGECLPVADFANTNYVLLTWADNTLSDLKAVLGEQDLRVRGELYCSLVPGPDSDAPYDLADYIALVDKVDTFAIRVGMTADARRAAMEVYEADPNGCDFATGEFRRVQRAVDALQREAVLACDRVLSYIRFKKAEKDWKRANEAATGTGMAAKPQTQGQRPSPLAEPTRVKDAAMRAAENGVDFGEIGPTRITYDAAALGLSKPARAKELAAAGLDGGRVCELYDGLVWEAVIGPLKQGLDYNDEDLDLCMVVIAPRRTEGGIGVDMANARIILVSDYETFFMPIEG